MALVRYAEVHNQDQKSIKMIRQDKRSERAFFYAFWKSILIGVKDYSIGWWWAIRGKQGEESLGGHSCGRTAFKSTAEVSKQKLFDIQRRSCWKGVVPCLCVVLERFQLFIETDQWRQGLSESSPTFSLKPLQWHFTEEICSSLLRDVIHWGIQLCSHVVLIGKYSVGSSWRRDRGREGVDIKPSQLSR